MRKIILLVVVIFITGKIISQTNADCINAIPLCTTPNFTFFATSGNGAVNDIPTGNNVSNPTSNPASANSGCLLSGENKPQWLLITIGNAGNLEFVFGAGTSANPQAGYYDWAMWPYSPGTCSNIMNNSLPPIRCNWNAISSGGTGIASSANYSSFGGNGGNFEPPLAVNACQQFIICISNYSGVNTLVSFQSLGTASLSCNPNCNPNYVICAGVSTTITPVNFASLTNPTYSLNPGALSNTTGSFVVSPPVTTTYTTYITGTNSSNVVQTTTALTTVTVNGQASAAPTVTQASCTNTNNAFNLGLTFNPSSPVPNYTVTWSPIPFSVTNATQTSGSGGIASGLYTATVTAAGGCSTTTSFSINPTPSPAVFNLVPNASVYTVTCAQPTVVINLNPSSYSYTWTSLTSPQQTGPTGNFTSANQGTWTVTGVNSSGCSSSQTFTVTQNIAAPVSTVSPLVQNINCAAGSASLVTANSSPSINITHSWISPNNATVTVGTPTAGFLPGGPGVYTHCITNNVNGCSTCVNFTVNTSDQFPTFSVTSSPPNFTLGCSTKSISTIQISNGASTIPPGSGPVSYTVIGPSTGSYPSGTVALSGTQNWTVNAPGNYTVVTKDNTNYCETKAQITVVSNTAAPTITATAMTQTLSCFTPSTVLQGLSNNPGVSYSWAYVGVPGNVPNDTLSVHTTTNTNSNFVGTYTLTVTDNGNLCKSTQTLTIYQNIYRPIAIITPTQALSINCYTATSYYSLSNGSLHNSLSPTQSLPIAVTEWDSPQLQFSTTYTAYAPGTYTMYVQDQNNGCTTYTTKTIGDNRIYPIVNTPSAPGPFILDCGAPGATIYPIVTGTTTGFTYSWTAVPTTSFSSYITATTTVNQPGIYKVTVTNNGNGCSAPGNVQVTNGSINADFTPSPNTGYAPLLVNFTNHSASSSTTSGTSSITTVWSFGNGQSLVTNSASISPSTTYTNAGTYTVTMYVSKGSCFDTISKVIKVELPSKLEVPNVFTPNGDGSNDVFFLKVANVTEINALIFDRWGNKVFESNSDTGNIAWDGKNMSGKDASVGTYFYIIKATGKDGTSYDKKGNVSLYR